MQAIAKWQLFHAVVPYHSVLTEVNGRAQSSLNSEPFGSLYAGILVVIPSANPLEGLHAIRVKADKEYPTRPACNL